MSPKSIHIPQEEVATFCQAHRIRRLALFGSVLREDFGPGSDLDVLVEFESGATPSLLGMAELESELSELTSQRVDLRTSAEISKYFRDEVVRTSEVQYAQG